VSAALRARILAKLSSGELEHIRTAVRNSAAQLPTWQRGEPPHDRVVIIEAQLVYHGEAESWCESVCCKAVWLEGPEISPGWHFESTRLSIQQSPEDELTVFFWSEVPLNPGDIDLDEAVLALEKEWEGTAQ